MILLRATKIGDEQFKINDHLGKTKVVTGAQLKAVIKNKSAVILNYTLNGRNQLVEKDISAAEQALWKIYVQVELFGGNDGYEETEEDEDSSWMHYKYYTDLVYFRENVDEIIENYFNIKDNK